MTDNVKCQNTKKSRSGLSPQVGGGETAFTSATLPGDLPCKSIINLKTLQKQETFWWEFK